MNKRRRLTGFVTSDKMMKTVVVEVTRTYSHPLYKKVVHSTNRFKAHDELGARIGDQVVIVESRPISREKHWVVETILRRQGEKRETTPVPAAAEVEAPAPVAEIATSETAVEEAPAATDEGEQE